MPLPAMEAHAVEEVLSLQQSCGNAAVSRMLAAAPAPLVDRHDAAPLVSRLLQGPATRDHGGDSLLQRFGSEEHRQLGEEASGGATVDIDLGDGTRLTYGEMVALAGDFFESIEEMRTLASTPAGQAELRWARWNALRSGPEPGVDQAVKDRVLDRYYRLAANNFSHFSAGGTARNAYEEYHRQALAEAFLAGASLDDAKWSQALGTEAFGNHFLTDMFSAGHVRTPRQPMKEWYQEHYPDSLNRFVNYAADRITHYLDQQGDIPWYWPNSSVSERLRGRIMDLGGSAIESFSLGDIVGLAHHDMDNVGLGVVSELDPDGNEVPGGFQWTAKGDSHLAESPITRQMTVASVQASLNDLDRARQAGEWASGGTCMTPDQLQPELDQFVLTLEPFEAERYIPEEDLFAGNPVVDWHWGQLDPVLRQAVDDTVKGEITNTLRGKQGAVPEELRFNRRGGEDPDGAVRLRVRIAFVSFCDELGADGITAMEAAMGGPASPPPSTSGGDILDAGVPLPAGVPDDTGMDAGVGGADAGVPSGGTP
jgi:hypothetical protein